MYHKRKNLHRVASNHQFQNSTIFQDFQGTSDCFFQEYFPQRFILKMKQKYDEIRFQKFNMRLCYNAQKQSIYNNRV